MIYLLEVCNNSELLNFIYLGKKISSLLFLFVPIVLIVLIIIDVFKMVTGASEEKTIKSNTKSIINRIVFAVLIFFVPTIVDVVMSLVANAGIDVGQNYKECMNNLEKRILFLHNEKYGNQPNDYSDKLINTSLSRNENNSEFAKNSAYHLLSVAEKELNYLYIFGEDNFKYSNADTFILRKAKGASYDVHFVNWVFKESVLLMYIDYGEINADYVTPSVLMNYFNNQDELGFYKKGDYLPKTGDLIFYKGMVGIVKSATENNVLFISFGRFDNDKHTEFVEKANIPSNCYYVSYFSVPTNSPDLIGYGSWYQPA